MSIDIFFLASTVKMASAETPHYELFDEEKNIMIYGIKIEELFLKDVQFLQIHLM